jgi:cobalt/nickel transport system permease protein
MHLGTGAITLECAALGLATAATGVGYSGWMARNTKREMLSKAAALGAFVFAAQMLNVPVLNHSSAHFVGGVLLAELLGPALGVLTMSLVLLLQAVILGDGGLAALGVNITNMALVPAGCLMLFQRLMANHWLALSLASCVSIALAVLSIGGAVALGRAGSELTEWSAFAMALTVNHLPALALEAAVTVLLAALWRRAAMDANRSTRRLPTAASLAALVLLAISMVTSSSLPDGYESAAKESHMNWLIESE